MLARKLKGLRARTAQTLVMLYLLRLCYSHSSYNDYDILLTLILILIFHVLDMLYRQILCLLNHAVLNFHSMSLCIRQIQHKTYCVYHLTVSLAIKYGQKVLKCACKKSTKCVYAIVSIIIINNNNNNKFYL